MKLIACLLLCFLATADASTMMGGTAMGTATTTSAATVTTSATNCPSCGATTAAVASAALSTCPARNSISDEQCPLLMGLLAGPTAGCTCYNFCGSMMVGCGEPLAFCKAGAPVNGCVEGERLLNVAPTAAPVGAPNKQGCGYCPVNAVALVSCVKTPFDFNDMTKSECQCKPNYIYDSGRCRFCQGCAPSMDHVNSDVFERDGCIIDAQYCYPTAGGTAASVGVVNTSPVASPPVSQPTNLIMTPPIMPPTPVAQPTGLISNAQPVMPPQTVSQPTNLISAPVVQPVAAVVVPAAVPVAAPTTSVVACAPGQVFNAQFNTCFPAASPTISAPVVQPVAAVVVPAAAPVAAPTASVVTCGPGQVFNAQFNTCFPAASPTISAPVVQPTLVTTPVTQILTLPTVPTATIPSASNFIFGNNDDDDEDCCSDNGKSKGDSSNCNSKSKGDGKSNCCSDGKSKGDSNNCRSGKGGSSSDKESIEAGFISSAKTVSMTAVVMIASAAFFFF